MERDALFPQGLYGIIFDCDGVMIDSEAANRYFYNTILATLNLPPMTEDQERYSFMATAMGALRKMTPPEVHPRLREIIGNTIDYNRDILPKIKLMPGFEDFMRAALDRGLKLAIDTNRTAEGIQRVLAHFDLSEYFNPVISASVAVPKPSPDGAQQVFQAWNVPPQRTLFVGDSEDDMEAANSAGARFAAFGGRGLPGDIRARDFVELGARLWWKRDSTKCGGSNKKQG